MKFNLGTPALSVDLETLVDSRLLVQANSGGGKSWLLRYLMEKSHGHVQQIVIDPEGEFGTIREKFDYVYAARSGGDTAADPRSAKLLAERLLELKVSAILDIYDLKAHDRIRFVRHFLEAMIDAPKHLWHPVMVYIDEAHGFCPQKGEAESAGAVIDLCTRGRKRGYCAVLATQRLSKLHKDAAAELNNKLIGRTGLDVDMARAAEELGFTGREERMQLRSLPKGHFFAFGPAISDSVTRVHVGQVQTKHPEAGSRIAFTPPPPTAKVKALLPKLADLPAEAEHEARSMADLRKENAELKRQATMAQRAAPKSELKKVEVLVEVPLVPKAALRQLNGGLKELLANGASLGLIASKFAAAIQELEAAGAGAIPRTLPSSSPRPSGLPDLTKTPAEVLRMPRPPVSNRTTVPKAERLILGVLAQHPEGRTIVQVAIMTGYAANGGGFRNAVGALRARGLVEGDRGEIRATAEGLAAAGDVPPLPVGEELLRHWMGQLPKAERSILEALHRAGAPLTVEAIASDTNYEANGGGFRNALGRLRTLELISGDRGRPISLAEELR